MSSFVQRKKIDSTVIHNLCKAVGCGKDLAEVLAIRGFEDPVQINKFLHPDIADLTPVFAYNGMKDAAGRINNAVENHETVVIYGDYDCDGVCATSILFMCLASLGLDVKFYIPNRKREGYGINRDAIEEIADSLYPDLIITVDCGITAKEDIDYAMNELGIDVIVTDHHEPPKDLPDCIIVNPKVDRKAETFNELCGAGIALRLCEAVGGREELLQYIDLAAIATIGDIVPLIGDNRIIVSKGMQLINKEPRAGIKSLLEVAGVTRGDKINSTDIAFKIVPRINAVGRLSDSKKAVLLLVEKDYFFVQGVAEQANNFNKERQIFTDDLVADCLRYLENYDLVSNRIIVLYSDMWEAGVLGIAAAKITGLFGRPTILLTSDGDVYKGSARSIPGVNIFECVSACKSFLSAFGGHTMACGVTCPKQNIESFCFAINEYASYLDKNLFVPHEDFDLEREYGELSFESISELEKLQPFGQDNPRVKYKISINTPIFNRISTSKHIKFSKNKDVELVFFDGLKQLKNINESDEAEFVCDFSERSFQNRIYAQGIVQNVQFDWDKFEFDQKYMAIRYAYLAKYEKTSVFDVQLISADNVLSQMENDLYGVCFITYSHSTYQKYSRLLADKIILRDCNVATSVNPLNRLIIDPDFNQNLAYYKKIVFLDTLPSLGVIDYYKFNANAKIMMVKDSLLTDYMRIVKEDFPSTEKMREIFAALRKLLAVKTKITSFSELFGEYQKTGGKDIIAFYIAMFVFYELKIIKLNGGFYVDSTVKTSLDNSSILHKIKGFIDYAK